MFVQKGLWTRNVRAAKYLGEALALAIVFGMGAGFGEILYTSQQGFLYAKGGLVQGEPWVQMFGYGLIGVGLFLPAELIIMGGWVFYRYRAASAERGRGGFHIYYLLMAYGAGLILGLAIGALGKSQLIRL